MNTLRRAAVSAITAAIGMAGCAPKEQAAAPAAMAVDTAAVMAGMDDLWTRWITADTAQDLEAQLALTTDNVRFDVKGMPVMIGKESARAVLAPLYGQVDYLEASIVPEATSAVTNELALQRGAYTERYTVKGQPGERTDYSRYAAAAVKGADGQWRWTYMMAFTDSTVTRK